MPVCTRLISLQFDTLDIAVQEEFEKFLQERGINDSLAMFVPEYAEHKEQKVCHVHVAVWSGCGSVYS
jgi:hypothetical protein